MTGEQLLAEITNDPNNYGYAQAGIEGKLQLLNVPRVGISIERFIPKESLLEYTAMVGLRAAALEEPGRGGWNQVLASVRSSDGLNPSRPKIAALLTAAVAAGVLTPEELAELQAMGTRLGSRAEQLWGEGTFVSLNDLARIL